VYENGRRNGTRRKGIGKNILRGKALWRVRCYRGADGSSSEFAIPMMNLDQE